MGEVALATRELVAGGPVADGHGASAEALPVRTAVATLTQNILGAGMLAFPFAFKSAGLAGGLALLVLVYALSVVSMGALVLLASHLGSFSYKDIAAGTLGPRLAVAAEVWVLCYNLGICVSYPILLGDFLNKIAVNLHAAELCTKRRCMVATVVLVCWPLSCSPTLGNLKWMTLAGMASIFFAVIAVVTQYADGSYEHREVAAVNWGTFGACFPILVGAFGAHYNIPSLFREVAPSLDGEPGAESLVADAGLAARGAPAFRRMMRVIAGALTLSAATYGVVGVVVYATFGSGTLSDFTQNFRPGDGMLVVVRATMACAICASFPLTMVSARSAAFNLFLKPRGWAMTGQARVALATLLTALCLAAAAAAGDDLGVVLDLNGSVFGTPVCYVAPAVMYLRLPPQNQLRAWRLACAACAAAGVAFGCLGVVVALTGAAD